MQPFLDLRDGALNVNSAAAGTTGSGRVVPLHPCGRKLKNPGGSEDDRNIYWSTHRTTCRIRNL